MQLSSVTVAVLLESGCLPIPVHSDVVSWSGDELKSEGDIPLNYCGNQAHALLVANETRTAYQKQTRDGVAMPDLDDPCTANVYEPERMLRPDFGS
jgi:hypothetical protein